MDIFYKIRGVVFEWDSLKAVSNADKHSVTFTEAAEVFFDPFYQTGDSSADNEEQRNWIIGYSSDSRLLLVVYTDRNNHNRIIPARITTRAERKIYEQR